jgi:hypothetical protein
LFVVVGGIIAIIYAAVSHIRKVEDARRAYQSSLAQLRSNPTSPQLRENTLKRGRYYASLVRSRGRTTFDEVALMNDINAVCAGTVTMAERAPVQGKRVPSVSDRQPADRKKSVKERLQMLADLKAHGFVDDVEYESRKRRILDEV